VPRVELAGDTPPALERADGIEQVRLVEVATEVLA
jgi:hypothetical protein